MFESQESQIESNPVDISRLFRYILMQSKLIISITLTIFILLAINYYFSSKYYKITSLLEIESSNQNLLDPTNTLQFNATGSQSSDLNNLVALYQSRTNVINLIKNLKLNILFEKGTFHNSKPDISITSSEDDNDLFTKTFYVSNDSNGISIYDKNKNIFQTSYVFGEKIYYDELEIIINDIPDNYNETFLVKYNTPSKSYNKVSNSLTVKSLSNSSWFSKEGLMEISYVTDDINEGKKIINYANNIFLNYRVNVETEKARKAINFIDQNIESIERIVESNKIALKSFRESNKSINVDLEIEGIVESIQSIDQSLYETEFELAQASEIYTSQNPLYLNLVNKKKILNDQKNSILSKIGKLPQDQQQYIDLYKNVEISQNLLEELQNRKLAFSIVEASTLSNIRVIDSAYMERKVSPQLSSVIVFTIFAFIIACFIAIIRGSNYLPVTNPAELLDNGIQNPILGVLPFISIEEHKEDVNTHFSQSLESLMVNIKTLEEDQTSSKIISITSPTPSNGKSTISNELAKDLLKLGKKVLLIDNDLKRGSIGKEYGKSSISEKKFNNINNENMEDYKIYDNFYLIPRVKGLSNTFQFLYSNNYRNKLEMFKKEFDYIVFDTAPLLSVSDTPVLLGMSDINILIARHGVSRINEIKQCIDSFKQIGSNLDGIIYNAYSKPKSYYGYYEIYGNYAYQYYAEKYLDDNYDYKS